MSPSGHLRLLRCRLALCVTMGLAIGAVRAGELTRLESDHIAIERVYYGHLLGTKPPFDQVMSAARVQAQVRQDLKKEAELKTRYGLEVTTRTIEAEARRIDSSTRAPDLLNELKAALDNDPIRFAQSVLKPALIDRLLREQFENDSVLHSPQRRRVEEARTRLLVGRQQGLAADALLATFRQAADARITEITWRLGARPAENGRAPAAGNRPLFDPVGLTSEMTLVPRSDREGEFYFEDLPAALKEVLRVQLSKPGDVSAVIELPSRFNLYLVLAKDPGAVRVATLSVEKQSYEQWLAKQSEFTP